ncbi:uncharacterized protein UBRO2_05402 [Ustilago bromivora]|uniref:Arrestin C-terminal-like domain-containing protein n=1 Tax=Ustilago bromivora TaxID=307758 RepID=A0A8H8QRG5_9BASI|nr:uncharacterized protein UBRO2_05402 [Ustilago bromivora]
MSGLGIDFGNESEAYSTDTGSRVSAASTLTSGFHSRTRAHMIPKKSSMNKMRGARPKTAEEDARRVRIVSGEPSVLGHGAYTDEDFMSPISVEDIVVQPHNLHSLSAAVAVMNGYSTDTATSSTETETDSDQSPTLTESSVTSSSSGASSAQRINTLKKHNSHADLSTETVRASQARLAPNNGRPVSEHIVIEHGRSVHKSQSNTSVASGYRSDGGSSLGRSAEIPRGVGRSVGRGGHHKLSIRGVASRQGTLQGRLGPKAGTTQTTNSHTASQIEPVSDDETEVMVPDGFGGHTRVKQPRSRPAAVEPAAPPPALLQRIDIFYGPDGSETARIDHETGTISELASQIGGSDAGPGAVPSRISSSKASSVSLSRSQTSSGGPKASMMKSPTNQANAHTHAAAEQGDGPVEGSTKAAALEQNRRSRTSLASVSMRSKRDLQGLEEAERGGALVSLDNYRMTYDTGLPILPHEIKALDQDSIMGSVRLGAEAQPMRSSLSQGGMRPSSSAQSHLSSSPLKAGESDAQGGKATEKVKNRPRRSLSETNVNAALLERHGTLLSTTANPLRRNKELNRLLGNSDRKLPASAAKPMTSEAQLKNSLKRSNAVTSAVAPPPAALEQGKANKARVEVDLVLESDLVVERGTLQSRMQIRVRKGSEKEGGVFLAQPKIRVVGFEELLADDTRYIFYHHASVIDGDRSNNGPSEPYYLHGSPTLSSPETASFSALACSNGGPDAEGYAEGAKGSYRGKNAVVRYIVIGSVKLKSASGVNRSIAHFYRHVDLFPYLNPAVILSSALKPIQVTSSKGLFLGGSGKVHLMASLHRNTWVAGQRVYINVGIQNDTSKKINGMTLSLIRTVTLYKSRPELDMDNHSARRELDPDACQTSTTRKKIAEEELEMGQKGSRGVVTARGWWTGVEPGQRVESSHYMHVPGDALSISRGRHVEVVYSIKVSIGSVFSEARSPSGGSVSERAAGGDADQMVARLKSVDAMRSPGKTEISLQNYDRDQQAARMLSPGEVQEEQQRHLQHQKSLNFINHAIRSATARRGVDVTPTTNSSSARTPSPAGLGIGVLDSRSVLESTSGHSPSGGSSTDGVSDADEDHADDEFDEEEGDNTKTPMATTRQGHCNTVYPPGCEPYEQHHLEAHQVAHHLSSNFSQLPVTLHLPGGMHHMQQVQMQMYQMAAVNPAYFQRANTVAAAGAMGGMLPMLSINNANAVSLDEIGDDYDDEEREDRTLALNDESMAEMNMIIGSARLDDDVEYGQFDDSMYADEVNMGPVLEEEEVRDQGEEEGGAKGWSLRRGGSSEDEQAEDENRWIAGEEADDVAEVSSIMQTVSIAPGPNEGRTAPPPSTASATSSCLARHCYGEKVEQNMNKDPSAQLPQQVIRAAPSSENLVERSGKVAITRTHARSATAEEEELSTGNLKRHSGNLCFRYPQGLPQGQQQRGHGATHSVTGLKPLILIPRAIASDKKSSAGSRTPESATFSPSEMGVGNGEREESVISEEAQSGPQEMEVSDGGLPRSSTLQSIATHAKSQQTLRHSDSTSSLVSDAGTTTPSGALSRSHSTHNLRGAAVMVPSVRNKIAMLERRSAALREFTAVVGAGSGGNSPAGSPSKSGLAASTSTGRVAQLAERAKRAGSTGGLTPSGSRLGRKGSFMSVAESEDGGGSMVSSVVSVPDYMKAAAGSGGGGVGFNAPVLRNVG